MAPYQISLPLQSMLTLSLFRSSWLMFESIPRIRDLSRKDSVAMKVEGQWSTLRNWNIIHKCRAIQTEAVIRTRHHPQCVQILEMH